VFATRRARDDGRSASATNGVPGSIVLSIPASKIEVRITKSNDQKLAM
jgi:hypothetical protein